MSLADFLSIFASRLKLFFWIIGGIILLALLLFRLQDEHYTASVLLSVTRSGVEQTSDYQYHEFYRLQADERFADTLVQYLGTPQAKHALNARASLSPSDSSYFEGHSLGVKRVSSNLVVVSVPGKSREATEREAQTLSVIANQYAESLNKAAREPDWFQVVASDPEVADARFSAKTALLGGLIVGLFLAFWGVLASHYWSRERGEYGSR